MVSISASVKPRSTAGAIADTVEKWSSSSPLAKIPSQLCIVSNSDCRRGPALCRNSLPECWNKCLTRSWRVPNHYQWLPRSEQSLQGRMEQECPQPSMAGGRTGWSNTAGSDQRRRHSCCSLVLLLAEAVARDLMRISMYLVLLLAKAVARDQVQTSRREVNFPARYSRLPSITTPVRSW